MAFPLQQEAPSGAVSELLPSAARPGPVHRVLPMGLEQQRFLWAAALASGCAVHRLELDRHRPGFEEPAEAIERLVLR